VLSLGFEGREAAYQGDRFTNMGGKAKKSRVGIVRLGKLVGEGK